MTILFYFLHCSVAWRFCLNLPPYTERPFLHQYFGFGWGWIKNTSWMYSFFCNFQGELGQNEKQEIPGTSGSFNSFPSSQGQGSFYFISASLWASTMGSFRRFQFLIFKVIDSLLFIDTLALLLTTRPHRLFVSLINLLFQKK